MKFSEQEKLRQELLEDQNQERVEEIKYEEHMHKDVEFALEQLFSKDMTVTDFARAMKKLSEYGHGEISNDEVLEWLMN